MGRHKKIKRISREEQAVVNMFELFTESLGNGLCFLMNNIALPTHYEFVMLLGSEALVQEKIYTPLELCGGIENIRQEFARAEAEEAECDKINPYRINRFDILRAYGRLGTYGKFASLTSFCTMSGIDIRTAKRRKTDIFTKIARNLLFSQANKIKTSPSQG